MSEEVYSSSHRSKTPNPKELKKIIAKMKKSYQKGEQISRDAQLQQQFDSELANQELEKKLEEINQK